MLSLHATYFADDVAVDAMMLRIRFMRAAARFATILLRRHTPCC